MATIDGRFHPLLQRFFTPQEVEGCRLHFQGLIVRIISLPWLRQRSAAITFGRHIFLRPDYWGGLSSVRRVALLAHEMTHVRQYRRYGFLPFLGLYAAVYPLYFWRVSQHPLERPGYRMAQEVEEAARQTPGLDG